MQKVKLNIFTYESEASLCLLYVYRMQIMPYFSYLARVSEIWTEVGSPNTSLQNLQYVHLFPDQQGPVI